MLKLFWLVVASCDFMQCDLLFLLKPLNFKFTNISIVHKTPMVALLYFHITWLPTTKVGLTLCINLLLWKLNNLPLSLKYLWFVWTLRMNFQQNLFVLIPQKRWWKFWIKICHHQKSIRPGVMNQKKKVSSFFGNQVALGWFVSGV